MHHSGSHGEHCIPAAPTSGRKYRPLVFGAAASLTMLAVYFGVLTLVSGWEFTLSEFGRYWYFVVALAAGFGFQVALYGHLRQLALHEHTGGVVAASGTTSTAAMISCCAHYLTNVLPVVGATGLVAVVAQYQVELFWLGLVLNAGGMAFIGHKVFRVRSHMLGRHA